MVSVIRRHVLPHFVVKYTSRETFRAAATWRIPFWLERNVWLALSVLVRYCPCCIQGCLCLQCLVGRQEEHAACKKIEWWGAGVVICLDQGANQSNQILLKVDRLQPEQWRSHDRHKINIKWFAHGPADATATPSSLDSLESRLVWPFWCQLTQVVLEKRPLNGCLSSQKDV